MTLEKDFFRQVMGQFVTGVTVVTTRSNGMLAGLTVNSFTSVSLDPPLVLICVDLNSTTLPLIRDSGTFVVNFLSEEQEHLSRCFASPSEERYEHFCHASFHVAATGSPVIDNTLAFIDARVVAEYPGGDHIIFIGQVEALGTDGKVAFARENTARFEVAEQNSEGNGEQSRPLVYYRGKYRQIANHYEQSDL